MSFAQSDFEKMFLKNYFKEILKEEKQFQTPDLDDVCKVLAELHVKEFGSGKYPYEIISEYKSVESWLRNKIPEMKYDTS